MKLLQQQFLLRFAIAVILLMHALPSIVSGDVNAFCNEYLREQGFGAMGLPLAWLIKISHLAGAILLLANKWVLPTALVTIVILIAGIWMVHLPHGWYVVGGGSNGVEFNFLLIFALLNLILPLKKQVQ